jgi:putative peptidoglycan lipid II flippase
LSALLNAGMLWWGLRKIGVYQAQPGWPMFTLRLLLACAALSVVVLWLAADVQQWFEWGWQQKVLQMSILVVAGIAVFLVTLVASGMRMSHVRK